MKKEILKKEFRKWCKKYVSKTELKKYPNAIIIDFLCCKGYYEDACKDGLIKFK